MGSEMCIRDRLCSNTGASSGELCFGSHALKNAAVGVPQITDTLEARAESLRQMCNADAEAEADVTSGDRKVMSNYADERRSLPFRFVRAVCCTSLPRRSGMEHVGAGVALRGAYNDERR